MTQNKIRNSLHHRSYYSNDRMSTRGISPANSVRTSPRLSDASKVLVIMHVRSQQTSPSISYMPSLRNKRLSRKGCLCQNRNKIPGVKITHTSPNINSFLDVDSSNLPNLCVTDNPMWRSEMISECSKMCVPKQKRSPMNQSFSIHTITSKDAETVV